MEPDKLNAILQGFEQKTSNDCSVIGSLICNQFNQQNAALLAKEGLKERDAGDLIVLDQRGAGGLKIILTRSAECDLNAFTVTKPQVVEVLRSIPSRLATTDCYATEVPDVLVLRKQLLRVVFQMEPKRSGITVFGIANAAINPYGKVYRYFTHAKAEDLIRTSQLYFRRADLLDTDPYECRLPLKVVEQRERAIEERFPGEGKSFVGGFEISRQSSFICCWTMRESESYLAWKHYCDSGGFALQTTQRLMTHLHSKLRTTEDVYSRQVGYLDHWTDTIPSYTIGEEVFHKAKWFSDERELRLAVLRPYSWSNSAEWQKPSIPDGLRIPVNLEQFVSRVILNPFSTDENRTCLQQLIAEQRPDLVSRIQPSAILEPPPLSNIEGAP